MQPQQPPQQPMSSSHPLYKTKLCSHWQRGFCLYGSMCQFAHGDQELRHATAKHRGRHHSNEIPTHNGPQTSPAHGAYYDQVAASRGRAFAESSESFRRGVFSALETPFTPSTFDPSIFSAQSSNGAALGHGAIGEPRNSTDGFADPFSATVPRRYSMDESHRKSFESGVAYVLAQCRGRGRVARGG